MFKKSTIEKRGSDKLNENNKVEVWKWKKANRNKKKSSDSCTILGMMFKKKKKHLLFKILIACLVKWISNILIRNTTLTFFLFVHILQNQKTAKKIIKRLKKYLVWGHHYHSVFHIYHDQEPDSKYISKIESHQMLLTKITNYKYEDFF